MTTLTAIDFVTKQALLELVAKGIPLVKACDMVGTNRRAVNALMNADPEFAEDMTEAHDRMVARVDTVVYDEAVDGNMKAVEMFYRQHRPEIMQTTGQRQAGAAAPVIQVAQMTVQIAAALLSSDAAPQWLAALHKMPEPIEARVMDDDPDAGE